MTSSYRTQKALWNSPSPKKFEHLTTPLIPALTGTLTAEGQELRTQHGFDKLKASPFPKREAARN